MAEQVVRRAISDGKDPGLLASVVQSLSTPLVNGQVVLGPDGGPVPVTFSSQNLITYVDEASPTVTYVGKATPGSATSAAVWSIKKITSTNPTTILLAASGAFTQVRDNRASLSYS